MDMNAEVGARASVYCLQSNTDCAEGIRHGAEVLRKGGLVVFPTETVYGIGCNAMDPQAVSRLYRAKNRPAEKPLLLHLYSMEQAEQAAVLDDRARKLLRVFTPGPLSVVLPKRPCVPYEVTSGGETVGLRFPSHPLFLALAREAGVPIAATSANFSGSVSAKDGKAAAEALSEVADVVLDGGRSAYAMESTVVSLVGEQPKLLRQGAIPWERVEWVLREDRPRLIGLTGRSGTGKSTAGNCAREMGIPVLDCDELYRQMTASPTACLRAIGETFGEEAVRGGTLNRPFLRGTVFSDREAMEKLNRITAIYMEKELFRLFREEETLRNVPMVLLDAPTLFESGLNVLCDRILCVIAPEERAIERICRRDGIDETAARARLEQQKEDRFFASHCDILLRNDGTPEDFREDVREALERLRRGGAF
ncbi:MAG: threonylcarbamoyl-AMP synthase [Oscillospiraceae bacterium]|nr:threonylcarbamoyl-AMP synthase [Oscillospiraceae bacterium]